MHWSKSRHVQYENCPRQFFYEAIAAPLNPRIAALRDRPSPPLARHDAVRSAVLRIVNTSAWTSAHLPSVLADSRGRMLAALGNEADVNAQMSIVEACVGCFGQELLPLIRSGRVAYVSTGEPVEFIYDGLSIMALPEVVVEHDDRLEIYQFKTGSPSFWGSAKERDLRLRAGGLTCWARCSLNEVTRPVHVMDVYLRESPLQMRTVTLDDGDVRAFIADAKSMVPQYSGSMKIADFPADPNFSRCRFCDYQPICPEYRSTVEPDYGLDALSDAIMAVSQAEEAALVQAGGELRQVFLSHVSEDKDGMVRPFARALEAAGISYWLDEGELMWGDSLAEGLNKGLATSDYVITFITENFLQRGWTKAELHSSLVAHVNGKKRLMPVFVAARDVVTADYPMLGDIIGRNWTDGIPALVAELRRILSHGTGSVG
jgi:hypothetical protein